MNPAPHWEPFIFNQHTFLFHRSCFTFPLRFHVPEKMVTFLFDEYSFALQGPSQIDSLMGSKRMTGL